MALERIEFERRSAVAAAVRHNENMALAFEQQTARTLQAVDQVLRFVRHEYLEHGNHLNLSKLYEGDHILSSLVTSANVTDEKGVVRFSSGNARLDLSDRDYFLFHRDHPEDVLFVGQPVTSRRTGRTVILASRAIMGAQGEFRGVAVLALDPEDFADFYRRADIGANGVLQLVGLDGVARVRRVANATRFGIDMGSTNLMARVAVAPRGNFVSSGRFEGRERFMSYRTLKDYPFVVAVGTAVDEELAGFYVRRLNYYAGAGAASLALLLCAAFLLWALARHRRSIEERRRADERYRDTFDRAPVGIAHQSMDGRYIKVNPALCAMLGYTEGELLKRTFLEVLHPDDAAKVLRQMRDLRRKGARPAGVRVENRHIRKDGSELLAAVSVTFVEGESGMPEYCVAMVEDITERKAAEAALKRSEERLAATFNQAAVGIATATLDMALIEANARFGEMLGYAPQELAGRFFRDFTHPEDVTRSIGLRDLMLADPAAPFSGELEKRYLHKDGRVVWVVVAGALVRDAAGRPDYFVVVTRDITEQKQTQQRLEHRSYYDALTDLPNRQLLADRLAQALTQAGRKRWTTGLLLLDLDRFKAVNDALGHAGGDELLCEAARRLAASVRAGDTVARVGGDEFAVMLTELAKPADAALVSEKIRQALSAPFVVQGQELFVSASIGIATEPPDGGTEEVLFKNAEAAKFRAKELGRNTMQFYAAAMNERVLERVLVENDLRRALDKGEFVLHYQPKARIAGRPVAGFEALLRWNRNGQGLVPPGQFIPVLEESGLILPVGEWVIREACRQLRAWEDAGLHPLPIAVNVSARQFAGENALSEVVSRAVAQFHVDPRLLEIEITESDVMRDAERAIAEMARLRELGVRLSIDDFGTGYSSLGYLKRFPVHKLKLDRSFVTGLPHDVDDVSIARAVVSMAHSLRLQVVAEGVETEAQRAFLAEIGCDQLQGYLIAPALPVEQCGRFFPPQVDWKIV